MAIAAVLWLSYETYRFFWQPQRIGAIPIHPGAIDLNNFHLKVTLWFSDAEIFIGGVYPPASVALLWPLYGWSQLETVMAAWWLTAIPALAWLVWMGVRETAARNQSERAFLALLPLAIYPTGATIGNGQLTLHVTALLLGGLLLLRKQPESVSRDLFAALLILLACAKPTITGPFLWLVLFMARSLRPAVLVCTAYAALTFAAVWLKGPATSEILNGVPDTAALLNQSAGESNLHSLLYWLGRPEWSEPASIAVFLLFGLWVWRYRQSDFWLLVGVSAIVARFWSYHRWYDDMLLLLPMIALYRLAKTAPPARDTDLAAGTLFVLTLAVMLAPGGRYLLPAPLVGIWGGLQVTVWLADLVFLMGVARGARGKQRLESAVRTTGLA